MNWKLSPAETAGVLAVGAALAFVSNKLVSQTSGPDHMRAMLASGAVLYTAGVIIGANRPAQGFIEGGY
jgi:hypothetical protein